MNKEKVTNKIPELSIKEMRNLINQIRLEEDFKRADLQGTNYETYVCMNCGNPKALFVSPTRRRFYCFGCHKAGSLDEE